MYFHSFSYFFLACLCAAPVFQIGYYFHWWHNIDTRMWTNWFSRGQFTHTLSLCSQQNIHIARQLSIVSSSRLQVRIGCVFVRVWFMQDVLHVKFDLDRWIIEPNSLTGLTKAIAIKSKSHVFSLFIGQRSTGKQRGRREAF